MPVNRKFQINVEIRDGCLITEFDGVTLQTAVHEGGDPDKPLLIVDEPSNKRWWSAVSQQLELVCKFLNMASSEESDMEERVPESVIRGLSQLSRGEVVKRPSYSEYVTD